MSKFIHRNAALGLIAAGKAKAESLVYRADNGERTYVSITRFDTQTTEHVLVGDGDLRGTAEGERIADEFGIS